MTRGEISALMLKDDWDWERIRKFLYRLEEIVIKDLKLDGSALAPGWLIFIATDEQASRAWEACK